MQRFIIAIFLAFSLAGCATNRVTYGKYGNLLPYAESSVQQQIAADGADQLSLDFLPAKTQIVMVGPTKDMLGVSLLQALRQKGYAVTDYSKNNKTIQAVDADTQIMQLYYTFSPIASSDNSTKLYLFSLFANKEIFSRVYYESNGQLQTMGAWANRK